MSTEIFNTILLGGLFLALFAFGEIMYHVMKIKVEITRKIAHIGTGLLTLLFPIMLKNHWLVLILCTTFALILILSLKLNLLKSINSIQRQSAGSILYPISVYICYLAFDYFGQQYIYFYIPILILAICDPLATLAGKNWPIGMYKIRSETKTILGSTTFFVFAFLLSYFLLTGLNPTLTFGILLFSAAFIALITSISEGLSTKGFDNLWIPISGLSSMVFLDLILKIWK